MLGQKDIVYETLENYFMWNRGVLDKNCVFEVCVERGDCIEVMEKKYIDISHVNYWIDKEGNTVYKVHMRNGDAFSVDNDNFKKEYCPHGVNVINEVCKKEYL